MVASDCIVSPKDFDALIRTLVNVSHADSVILLAYEKRNFSEESEFFVKLSEYFRFSLVKEEDLDPLYRAPDDIFIFILNKK